MMSAPYEPAVLQRAMASSASAGAACPRFVQNAWRQDLCSNCFRLRQDHAPALTNGKVGQVFSSSSKCSPHVTTVYQSATSWHSSSSSAQESYSSSTSHLLTTTSGVVPCGAAPAVPGILRSGGRRASTGSVGFLEAAPQVIGYGGVEAQEETGEEEAVESSDDDDDDLGACDSLENYDLSAEEKAFAELTEKNTEFNAVIENLLAERHKEEQSRNSPEVVPSLAVPEAKTILAAEQPTRAPTEGSQFALPRPWVRMMNGGRSSREGEAAEQPLPPPPPPESETIDPPVQERVNGTSSPDPTLVPPPDYSVATQQQQQQQQQQPLEMHYSSSAILKGLPMPYSSTSVLKGLPRPPPPTSPAPSTPSPAATPLLTPAAPSTPSPVGSPGTKPSPPKTKPKLPAKPLKLTGNAEGTSGSSSASSSPETTPKIEEEIKGKMSVAAETSADDGDTAYGMVYRREVTEIRTSNEYSEIRDANTVSPEISSGNDCEEQQQQEQDIELESDDVDIELSFQAKVASIASHLDLSKRNPKRQAPPPPHSPLSPCSSIASSEPEQPASHGHNNSPPPTPTSPTAPRRVLPVSPPLVRKSSSKTGFFSPCAAASAPEGHQFLHHRESKKHRNKFSLKKLLKFGKDSDDGSAGRIKFGSATPANSVPERRPRPQILHPMDLANMAANQLANGTSSDCETSLLQNGSCETSSLESTGDMDKQTFSPNESPVPNDARVQLLSHVSLEQKNKPSPPPRAKCGPDSPSQPKRPIRPPPPTLQSAVTDNFEAITFPSTPQDENFCSDAASPDGGEYANLGEVRTVLVPKKPERGSPSTNPKETVVNTRLPVSQSNDLNEEPPEEQEIKDKEERTYYEPPEILDDIPPPVPLHNVQEASEMSTAYQVQSQVSVTTVEKVTRQERHARAAGVVFLDTNGGFGGSEESDTVSISSSEVASSPASNGPRDLSHLYAEVVRKAKRERHAICLQVSPDDETTQVVCNGHSNNGCVKRASLRNGHSAINRSLEENYNAVVAANHETLGQLLEQVLSIKTASSGCSRLKDSVLHWSDFAIDKSLPVKFGNTVMYNATWGPNVEVTLLVMPDPPLPPSSTKGPFILTPLATFHEFLPTYVLNPSSTLENDNEPGLQRGTVWVFRKTEVTSLQDVSRELALLRTDDIVEFEHSVCLLMLQLISALKHLQAQGVEEVDGSLDWLAIVRSQDSLQSQLGDDVLTMPLQLVLLGGGASSFDQGNMTSVLSLCECGLEVMATLLCGDGERAELDISERLSCKRAFLGVAETLQKEKSTSLSRAKTILELVLWGPTPEQSLEDEKALQRWLDLERATVLSELVTSRPLNRIDLSIVEEYRLLFLVRTNWRAIREAAAVIVSTTSTA